MPAFIVIRKITFPSGALMGSRFTLHECENQEEVDAVVNGRQYSEYAEDEFIVTKPVEQES